MSAHSDTMIEQEKNDFTYVEGRHEPPVHDEIGATFETEAENLPPGYYRSFYFIGTLVAVSMGFFAGVAGFGLIAPILLAINTDIGPDPNLIWVGLSYTLSTAVCITFVGRLSDIFGRRMVMIAGATLGVVGSIVGATSHNISGLIGATTIIGIAASSQLSYYYILGELVPMKYRFLANAIVYLMEIPSLALAPVISNSFLIHYPSVGWRGNYYLLIALNAVAWICWVLFYHPPTFHMKHRNDSVWKFIKNFDYVGTILYTGGLLIFLMGLNWGGGVYAWDSARVIATIVVGFCALVVLVLWECFMKLKEPLVPMKLFLHWPWVATVILSGLGQSIYYAFAIVWPQMVAQLYADGESSSTTAWLSSVSGIGWAAGIIIGGLVTTLIRRVKYQCFVAIFLGGLFFGLVATCTPDTKARACGLVAAGSFFIAWMESLAVTAMTLTAPSQSELGTAGGIGGCLRFTITSVATTVYNVVLTSQRTEEVPRLVPPALIGAGLPATSITAFIQGLAVGPSALEQVPGINANIIAAGSRAYKVANANSFRMVFFSTIAFTGVGLIVSIFLPDLDHLLTDKVAATLGKEKFEGTETESGKE